MESDGINDYRAGLYNKFAIPSTARLKLPDVFGDNMVFQREKPIRIWGVAPASSKVAIRLYEEGVKKSVASAGVVVAEDGTFIAELPAMPASLRTYRLEIENGATLRKYENIKIGEVIIATGQSNMQVEAYDTYEWDELAANATNDNLRFYAPGVLNGVDDKYEAVPQLFINRGNTESWTLGTDTARSKLGFVSAIGYSAAVKAYELFKADGNEMPVGLMSLPVGGTSIVCWLPRYAAETDDAFKRLLAGDYRPYVEGSTSNYIDFAALFNYKIAPVVNYNIGGILWYQGETDAGKKEMYEAALEKLIVTWGNEFRFENGEMPFVMSQIAPWNTGTYNNETTAIVAFNTVFSDNAATRPTRSAVAIYDCRLEYERGDLATIHTRYKKTVGERMGMAYYNVAVKGGSVDAYASPELESVTKSGCKLVVKFKNVGDGLSSKDGLPVNGFAIGSSDGNLYNAVAEITAPDTVEISNRNISDPEFCSYAYSSLNMHANLVNSEGFAALPFVYSPGKVLTNAQIFCQHDYLTFDRDEIWRYFPPRTEAGQQVFEADYVDLYTGENCTAALTDSDALRGKALGVTANGGATVTIPLGNPYDVHQFGRFGTFSVCAKGIDVTSVYIIDGNDKIVLTLKSTEDAGNGYTRYIFDLHNVTVNGTPDASYAYKDWLDSLVIEVGEGTGLLDEADLF